MGSVKEEILARVDFLAEYREIGVKFASETPNADGWVPCHSIDRQDTNASAAVNIHNGYYIDLGNAGRKLDFFDMMQVQGGLGGFKDVLDKFAGKFGLATKQAGRPKKDPQQALDSIPWNPNGERWCGIKQTNRDAVERAGGFLCRYNRQYICVAFPIYNTQDILNTDPTGYVVAQTDGKALPKFDTSGKKIGESKCKLVAGTTSGLIGNEALRAIADAQKNGTIGELTVFKVEGITDMTALLARIPIPKRGKWVVLTNASGAGEKPKQAWAPIFQGADVVIVHDADEPGQTGAGTWVRFLSKIASRVRNVELPYEITPNHGKDLKDFLTHQGADAFFELVEQTPDAEVAENPKVRSTDADDPHRLARMFLEHRHQIEGHPEIFALVYQQGQYFQWEEGKYTPLPAEILQAKLTSFCHEIFVQDYQMELAYWEENHGREAPPKVRKTTTRIVTDVMNALRSMVITDSSDDTFWRGEERPEEFADLSAIIPMQNGILHLGKLATDPEHCLLPTTPLLFNRHAIPVEYNPSARSTIWENMVQYNLSETDVDWAKLYVLQEFLGYCLIADTRLQKFLLLTGEGSNGKSAVLTAFSVMYGAQNVSNIALELFGDKFALAQLRGKLVNVVDDMSETDKVCEGKLKSVVSGMPISSDRKNKDGINFIPTTRLIFACNTLPRFQDKSNGILRRMIILAFKNTLTEEQRDPRLTDPAFWEGEKSGVFNWCLAGLMRLRANHYKLTPCRDSEREKLEYIADTNPASVFISDMLVQGERSDFIPCDDLYKRYTDWCADNGVRPVSSRTLGRELQRRLNVTRVRVSLKINMRSYVYYGITYADATPDYTQF